MADFESNIDSNHKIYLTRPLEKMLYPTVVIKAGKFAGVIFKKGMPLKYVRDSLNGLIKEIDNEIILQQEAKDEDKDMVEAFYTALVCVQDYNEEEMVVEKLYRMKHTFPLSRTEIDDMLNLLALQDRIIFTNNHSKIKVVVPEELLHEK